MTVSGGKRVKEERFDERHEESDSMAIGCVHDCNDDISDNGDGCIW